MGGLGARRTSYAMPEHAQCVLREPLVTTATVIPAKAGTQPTDK